MNGEILLNDGSLAAIPCYAYDINNGLAQTGQTISVLSGNMDFLTEDNEQSRKIRINNEFNEFGRTWHVDNIYYKGGIAHIITKVTEDNLADLRNVPFDFVVQNQIRERTSCLGMVQR